MRLVPAVIEALLGGLLGVVEIGLKRRLNNFLNKTLEWGLAWAGGGLERFASETLYRKQHLGIKKSTRVRFRDNLVGNYSGDAVFRSCSALRRDIVPS